MDINVITERTMVALLDHIGIDRGEATGAFDKKLNASRVEN